MTRDPRTRIAFHCEGDDGRMLEALRARLPTHSIELWPDITSPESITDAVIWQAPAALFQDLDKLERLHALSAGVDALLRNPDIPKHLPIYRLEDAGMGDAMAEYVLHAVLHAQRRFGDLAVAQQQRRWEHGLPCRSACEMPCGILGAGVLARVVAGRLRDNGYPVTTWGRRDRQPPDPDHVTGTAGLEHLLANSAVLICLLPLTPETANILDASLFGQLPDDAWLINVARGEHLVESDLITALDGGALAGAVLDVHHVEPLPTDHPFWSHPLIRVTPHLAAPSPVAGSVAQVGDNIERLESGQPLSGLVDRDRGY